MLVWCYASILFNAILKAGTCTLIKCLFSAEILVPNNPVKRFVALATEHVLDCETTVNRLRTETLKGVASKQFSGFDIAKIVSQNSFSIVVIGIIKLYLNITPRGFLIRGLP